MLMYDTEVAEGDKNHSVKPDYIVDQFVSCNCYRNSKIREELMTKTHLFIENRK